MHEINHKYRQLQLIASGQQYTLMKYFFCQVNSRVKYPQDYDDQSEEDQKDFKHIRYGTLKSWEKIFFTFCEKYGKIVSDPLVSAALCFFFLVKNGKFLILRNVKGIFRSWGVRLD